MQNVTVVNEDFSKNKIQTNGDGTLPPPSLQNWRGRRTMRAGEKQATPTSGFDGQTTSIMNCNIIVFLTFVGH